MPRLATLDLRSGPPLPANLLQGRVHVLVGPVDLIDPPINIIVAGPLMKALLQGLARQLQGPVRTGL